MSNPLSWITPEVFYRFTGDVGLNLSCKMCSSLPHRHYIDTGSEDGYVPRSSAYTATDDGNYVNMGDSRHLPCVRVTCVHCGHIDLYSMFAVVQWRDRKLAEQSNPTGSLFPSGTISG